MPNFRKPERGARFLPSLTIAIEPMVNAGGSAILTLSDKCTVATADGLRSARLEHREAILEDGPHIESVAPG